MPCCELADPVPAAGTLVNIPEALDDVPTAFACDQGHTMRRALCWGHDRLTDNDHDVVAFSRAVQSHLPLVWTCCLDSDALTAGVSWEVALPMSQAPIPASDCDKAQPVQPGFQSPPERGT